MSQSVSLLNSESTDLSSLLKAFRYINKNPAYNPFEFNYTKQEISAFNSLKTAYSESLDLLEQNKLPTSRLICLKADGNQDGHALYLENEAITFIDLKVYVHHLNQGGFDQFSHLLHEMLHASHYTLNKNLSPSALINKENPLLAKSLAEGVAVSLAENLSPQKDNFWFGYLDNELKEAWARNAEKYYKNDLHALKTGEYSKEQEINLK